jgi:anti-anti-sigma factor
MAMSDSERTEGEGHQVATLAEIECFERDGVRVIVVAGELDISNVDALEDAAFDLPNEALGIVVDLSGAIYIDSATIGLLFALNRSLGQRCQALRVVCLPRSNVQRVLELTGFDRESPQEQDRDAAIATIQRAVPLRD